MSVPIPPLVPDAQPLAVRTASDVLAVMDKAVRDEETAPVRDALVDGLLGLLYELQYRGDLAEAEADVLRASAENLRALGSDRGYAKVVSEEDADFRDRMLEKAEVTTKDAIVAATNGILAPHTTTECEFVDAALDRWFINDGAEALTGWHSFIGRTPSYPTRLFKGDENQNDGVFRPNSDPGGARLFADSLGRQFLLLVPDLLGSGDYAAFVGVTDAQYLTGVGWFVGDDSGNAGPIYAGLIGVDIYRAIVRTVQVLAGQSIRWILLATLEA